MGDRSGYRKRVSIDFDGMLAGHGQVPIPSRGHPSGAERRPPGHPLRARNEIKVS